MKRVECPSELFTPDGAVVRLGKRLGRGGEGVVHAIKGQPGRAAKIYSQRPSGELVEKLTVMTARKSLDLATQVAWPIHTLHRGSPRGSVRGFVMPRVSGGVEIHRLYTVKDRREAFPDCTWAFLVAVARNCASAFDDIHAAGCCVGDVNQKNILVMPDATVRILDCDSFQMTLPDGRVLLCPVGVPEFTPPELQGADFRRVPRTFNHDRFGLAVLIFHLLFVGRHPYAGVRLDSRENLIAEAIRAHRFAYSRRAHLRGIAPPPNAPLLDVLPENLAKYFERAFSSLGARGPRATEVLWQEALDAFSSSLRPCGRCSTHYRRVGKHCPWCEHAAAGIEYFPKEGDSASSAPAPASPPQMRAPAPRPASQPVARVAASQPSPGVSKVAPSEWLTAGGLLLGMWLLIGVLIPPEQGGLRRLSAYLSASEARREDPVGVFSGNGNSVFAVDFSDDGSRLLTNGLDGSARVWDVATRRELERRPLSGEVAFFQGNGTALKVQPVRVHSLGKDVYEEIWRQKLSTSIAALRRWSEEWAANADYVRILGPPPKEKGPPDYETVDRITSRVVMGRDGPFDVMCVPAPDDRAKLFLYYGGGVSLELTADGKRRTLVAQPENALTMSFGQPRVAAVAFSAGGSLVAIARPRAKNSEGNWQSAETSLWDGQTGDKLKSIVHAGKEEVNCLAFSPDGRFLAAGVGNQVELWSCR